MINSAWVVRRARYPSDTSDEQWALIEPLLAEVRTGGRPEKHPRRALVDAILHVVRTPPWQTVYWYFNRWEQDKVTEQILPVARPPAGPRDRRPRSPRTPARAAALIGSDGISSPDRVRARRDLAVAGFEELSGGGARLPENAPVA